MSKTSFAEKLKSLFNIHKNKDDDFFDELTDALIEGDIGAKTSVEIVETLQKKCKENKIFTEQEILSELKDMLLENVKQIELKPEENKVNVYMVLGVNGVGKTTSVAKMAKYYESKNVKVIMAAAVTQIDMHGKILNIRVVQHQMGSDPSAVVFDAGVACSSQGGGLVLVDTAGRLHNKENLVNELKKIDRIASSKASPDCDKKVIVV